jgi:tripartite-type tricarboxylate transporter receptor subunit TctC
VAPAGTPPQIVIRMHATLDALLGNADVGTRMLALGPIAAPLGSPEAVGAFFKEEHVRWRAAAKEIGLLPE